jgi:flagellar biosynthesis GTPase FlhF
MTTPADVTEALAREANAHLAGAQTALGETHERGGAEHAAYGDPGAQGEPDVRVFRGRTVTELIPKIEAELGSDALIVRRRDGLHGGFMGFFQQTYVEVEATRGTPAFDAYDDFEYAGPDGMDITRELELPARDIDPQTFVSQAPAPAPAAQVAPPAQPAEPARPAPTMHPAEPTQGAVTAPAAPPVHAAPAAAAAPHVQAPARAPAAAFVPGYDPYGMRSGARAAAANPAAAAPPAAATQPVQVPDGAHLPAPAAPPTWTRSAIAAALDAPAEQQPAVRTVGGRGAYLTPELAQLAGGGLPSLPVAQPAREPRPQPQPQPTARSSVDFQALLGSTGARPTGRSLAPGELLIAPQPASRREGMAPAEPPRPRERERRTVVAGSEGRAHAGVLRGLLRVGISEEFACELLEAADAHTLPLAPDAGLAQAVRSTLVQRIPQALPLPSSGAAVAVLGAGGSGKTTCCAALLAAYRAGSSLDASYATIMRGGEDGPLQMVLSPEVIAPVRAGSQPALRALHRVRSDGLAILDTPSLSPSDRRAISELADVIVEMRPDRVVVAMSAAVGAAAAEQMLAALEPLNPDALAITHADETDQLGVAVEAACRHGLAPELVLARGGGRGWHLHRCDPHELAARLLP